ncbi:hypothetical protein [Bacillus sp. JCM 19041]|uniref:hypothetical protein n=1 Tax=Bacillus sp. JCM 19041 TaxID=1460637 RepID=UPI0006D1E0E9
MLFSFTGIVFVGLICLLVLLLFAIPLMDRLEGNKIIKRLQKARWFQKPWFAGFFLFSMNALLFAFASLLLYLPAYFAVPTSPLFIMAAAVIASLLLWAFSNRGFQGTKSERLKMSFIGSSFYFFLTIGLVIWLLNPPLANQGDDLFMRDIGLMFGILVAFVAFLTSLLVTTLQRKKG